MRGCPPSEAILYTVCIQPCWFCPLLGGCPRYLVHSIHTTCLSVLGWRFEHSNPLWSKIQVSTYFSCDFHDRVWLSLFIHKEKLRIAQILWQTSGQLKMTVLFYPIKLYVKWCKLTTVSQLCHNFDTTTCWEGFVYIKVCLLLVKHSTMNNTESIYGV